MGPEVAAALSIIGTAASTGVSYYASTEAARNQNDAIKKSMESRQQAAELRQDQLAEQAAIERQKQHDRSQQILGRVRVAAAEAGVGMGGTYSALAAQAEIDRGRNEQIINRNFLNNVALIQSGQQADHLALSAQMQNPVLAGLTGGLTGLQTGLSISQGIGSLGRLGSTPNPEPYQPVTPPAT